MTINPLFFEKVLFKKLFQLIRKHGIGLVLQGLIEFAKTDTKEPKMAILAKDMQKALDRYKGKKEVVSVPGTWENLKPGVKVKCIFSPNSYFGQTAVIKRVEKSNYDGIEVSWDDPSMHKASCVSGIWSNPHSFEVIE